MNGKARTTRWRERQVADGGKPIGVTLTPKAAQALQALQDRHKWSQREAISLALEFAAVHPELVEADQRPGSGPPLPEAARIVDLEQRIAQLEALMAAGRSGRQEPGGVERADTAKRELIVFTASQMMEHGERMSRVQLYALARQRGVPVPSTQHEYNAFISYNMDQIRETMRALKERSH